MMLRVRVLALGVDIRDPNFKTLSGSQRIDLIKKRVIALMDKIKEPTIIVLSEYSISDQYKLPTSSLTKGKLKETISELTEKYPHLALYIPIITIKESSLVKAKEILESYGKDEFKIVTHVESQKSQQHQFELHKDKLKKIVSDYSEDSKIFSRRNTCFFSYRGKTFRLDKMAPYNETDKKNEIFKIGAKEKNTVRYLEMEDLKGSFFTVSLEICRENFIGVLKHKEQEVKVNPLIHLLLSGSAFALFENIVGKYFLQVDTLEPFRMILANDIPEQKQEVEFFVNNLLEDNANLVKVKGIYPFRKYITDRLVVAIQDFKDNKINFDELYKFKNMIADIYNLSSENILLNPKKYELLKKKILELEKLFDNEMVRSNENLKLYSSGVWMREILDKMDHQFIIETVFFDNDELSNTQKEELIEKLNKYVESRRNSFSNLFRDAELTTKKVLLAYDLIKKIPNIPSKLEILLLQMEYRKKAKKLDEEFNKNPHKSDFIKCLNDIRGTLLKELDAKQTLSFL